jgi:hypothetical protein
MPLSRGMTVYEDTFLNALKHDSSSFSSRQITPLGIPGIEMVSYKNR